MFVVISELFIGRIRCSSCGHCAEHGVGSSSDNREGLDGTAAVLPVQLFSLHSKLLQLELQSSEGFELKASCF